MGPRLVSRYRRVRTLRHREHLRDFFEVDAESNMASTLSKLAREGVIKADVAEKAFAELGLSTEGAGSRPRIVFIRNKCQSGMVAIPAHAASFCRRLASWRTYRLNSVQWM